MLDFSQSLGFTVNAMGSHWRGLIKLLPNLTYKIPQVLDSGVEAESPGRRQGYYCLRETVGA